MLLQLDSSFYVFVRNRPLARFRSCKHSLPHTEELSEDEKSTASENDNSVPDSNEEGTHL